MPAIGTSSDVYQHRDPALTTYRKNAAAPTLAEAMKERPREKKLDSVGRPRAEASAGRTAAEAMPPQEKQAALRTPEPITPARVVHELYAPPSRTRREHDDRHAMITGGTIDLRA